MLAGSPRLPRRPRAANGPTNRAGGEQGRYPQGSAAPNRVGDCGDVLGCRAAAAPDDRRARLDQLAPQWEQAAEQFQAQECGAHILLKEVQDAERFGVAEVTGSRISGIEVPQEPMAVRRRYTSVSVLRPAGWPEPKS